MRRILPEKYDNVRMELKKKLSAASHVTITTDIWTSCQTRSYRCITAHYLTEEWILKSSVLETFEFNNDHTAVHIAKELKRVIDSWGLETIVCVVTDNASNMVAAIRETGWRHLHCFGHTLNARFNKS